MTSADLAVASAVALAGGSVLGIVLLVMGGWFR